MLEVQGLSIQGGAHQVQGVDFQLQDGECHVLLGPTGAGKTMILEGLAGLRPIQSGRILLDGRPIQDRPPERRNLAYVPQDLRIFPHLRVRDNVRFALRVQKRMNEAEEARAKRLMQLLGIDHLEDRWPTALSGGERQRVALARALVAGGSTLLLDEPFASLNESLRRELWVLLKELQQHQGLCLLLVTHDLEEAFFLGDTISVLIEGRIHQTAAKTELYRRPSTLDVAQYLGIKNLFRGTVESQSGDVFRVACESLGRQLEVEAPRQDFQPGQKVLAGIRSEDVKVLLEGQPPHRNAFQGVIRAVFDRISALTYYLELLNAPGVQVELEIGPRARARLGLELGQQVQIAFKPSHVFLVSEPD